jgi:serine/threonine protein kinase
MWKGKSFSLQEIGIEGTYTIPEIPSLEITSACFFSEQKLFTRKQSLRATLSLERQLDHGSYGNIYLAKRNDTSVLVKQPRMEEMNLLQEAVLQYLAQKTLEAQGLGWAIPKVYDVFVKEKTICFSMERISGISISDWFSHTPYADKDTWHIFAQLSLILATLESHLNLDHRDLKISNLLLKPEPCTIHVEIHGQKWSLTSPFTVIVLDFGFACLGSELLRGKPWVNLGDGVLPPMDPCPKEGRDMFHLLISFLGLPIFREKVSQHVHDVIDKWLSIGKKSYGTMARRWSTENWSYLVSSQPTFAIPSCCPISILQDLLPELKGSLHRG